VHAAATRAVASPGGPLPYASTIQRAFGHHDISKVVAHTGDAAVESTRAIGADAFATGDHVVLGRGTDLFTVAHEAAHVVQQRAGVHLAGGVGAAGDEYEQHADAVAELVVRGESAEALLDRYAGGASPSSHAAVQRRGTALGLVHDVATSSMTKDVLYALLRSHGIEAGAEFVERLVLGYLDLRAVDYASALANTIATYGLGMGIEALASYVNPFVTALRGTLAMASMIPPSLRTLLAYGAGRSIVSVLTWCRVPVTTAEEWANKIFVGNDLTASLAYALQLVDDLLSRPISTIYKLAWSYWDRRYLHSTAPTPVGALVGKVTETETGTDTETGTETGTEHGPPVHGDPTQDEDPPEQVRPLVKKDLEYVWLEIDEPQLARFSKKEKENERPSGGLVLPFNLGLDLFGVKLASAKQQLVELPWSGGFLVELRELAITGVPSLRPVFTVGAIEVPYLAVTDRGLDALEVAIDDVAFAGGAAKLPRISATWRRGQGLTFEGALNLTIFDTPLEGRGALSLDAQGGYASSDLSITAPSSFTLIPDILSLANPTFAGSVDRSGAIALKLSSDIRATKTPGLLPNLQLEVDKAFVGWTGTHFEGGMDRLTVNIGRHVTLTATQARADRERITVAEASLVYKHDPDHLSESKQDLAQIGGVDPKLLGFTGVKRLEIGGKVTDLRIGKRVEVAKTDVTVPERDHDGAETKGGTAAKPAPLVDGDNFGVGAIEPVLSKLEAKLFGVTAMLDVENAKGSIEGEATYRPDFPNRVQFSYPIVPGLEVFAALKADLALGANIKAAASVPTRDRFQVAGEAGVKATIGAELQAGALAGSGWLAALSASAFGRAEATVDANTKLAGTLVLDREAGTLRPSTEQDERPTISYDAGAKLEASVGVQVAATALVMYERTLWRYTLKKWTLGDYRVAGEVHSGDGGEPLPTTPKGGFGGKEDGLPLRPEVENEKLENLKEELLKPQEIHGSAEERKRLLAELAREADTPTYRKLQQVVDKRTAQVHENVARRLEMAQKGGKLSDDEMTEHLQRQEKEQDHEDALARAWTNYKLVLTTIVDAQTTSDAVLEAGKIDLEDIENRIRAAAQQADELLRTS